MDIFEEVIKREQEISRLQAEISRLEAELATLRAEVLERAEAEISRLTENQRLQDSATAAVMERAERAEAEVAEQCRLHAMGAEREAKLMSEVAKLKKLMEGKND